MEAGTENQISGQVGEALERPALRVREAKDMPPMACPAHRHLILASRPFLSTCQRASAQPTLRSSHHGRWMGQDPWPMRDTPPPFTPHLPSVPAQYLLSMVVEYFGRVGLPGHLYNRIHFFLAL